jgi:hypothetical protein
MGWTRKAVAQTPFYNLCMQGRGQESGTCGPACEMAAYAADMARSPPPAQRPRAHPAEAARETAALIAGDWSGSEGGGQHARGASREKVKRAHRKDTEE